MPRKMIDMRRSLADKVEAMAPSALSETADYPYGLCISLDHSDLEKLDLDGDCEVGDMIHIWAMCRVTSCSSREVNGNPECRVELQITHLGVEDEDEEDE